MRSTVGRKLEMAARVRTFSRAHPSTEPGYAVMLGRLEEHLTRAEAIAAREHEARVSARGARSRRAELRKVVHFQLLRYLVAIGGIAARTRTELAERFKLPAGNASNRGFLTAVRSMLDLAASQKEAMVEAGMAPALLTELEQKLSEFQAVSDTARASRVDHIGARADLEQITIELMELVQVLDGINRWRFGDVPELLVAWNTVKHVAGSTQSRVIPPPLPGGTIAPAA